jgi:hypothetical protein
MKFRKFLENSEEVVIDGQRYIVNKILTDYDLLEKKYHSDDRWQSCVDNGWDTAIEMGYKQDPRMAYIVAKLYTILTAHNEYEMF